MSKLTTRRILAASAVAIVAAGASAAPAHAASTPGVSATCAPGESADASIRNPINGNVLIPITADCKRAAPVTAALGDGLLRLFGQEPILRDLNQAIAVGPALPTKASIAGGGITAAIAVTGGEAHSLANVLSLGVAAGLLGGKASANATVLGASVAVATVTGARAEATALPAALAFSTADARGRTTTTTAFGGVTSASSGKGPGNGAICTAAFGTAEVRSGNSVTDSCTSVGFLFQRTQHDDGPIALSVKNPLDVSLVNPFGESLGDLIGVVGSVVDVPDAVHDLLGARMVPRLNSDVVRVVMDPARPRLETDIPAWLRGETRPKGR